MRASLLERTREVLARAGYFLSRESKLRPMSFDLVARRDRHLLIVKVLTNVDALSESVASELRTLGEFLEATPLVIGERSSSRPLDTAAVYERHGVPIMAFQTLSDWLVEGVPPLVYAGPGGFYVKLDGGRLRAVRAERGLSLGQVAEAAGVSRRAVAMYEDGMAAMVDVAMRIEQFLDEPLVVPVDPWELSPTSDEAARVRSPALAARARAAAPQTASAPPASEPRSDTRLRREGPDGTAPPTRSDPGQELQALASAWQREVLAAISRMGFRVASVEKTPFDAVTKADDVVLTGIAPADADLARKAECVANLAEVTETFAAFVVAQRGSRVSIGGAAIVGREELADLETSGEFVDLVRERAKRVAR
ncbi:MAG: transcriptional regulator [Thermoplasmatota archaeon]